MSHGKLPMITRAGLLCTWKEVIHIHPLHPSPPGPCCRRALLWIRHWAILCPNIDWMRFFHMEIVWRSHWIRDVCTLIETKLNEKFLWFTFVLFLHNYLFRIYVQNLYSFIRSNINIYMFIFHLDTWLKY